MKNIYGAESWQHRTSIMKCFFTIFCLFVFLLPGSARSNDPAVSTEKLFERAKRLADHEFFAESIPLFEQVIAREPENRDYRVEAADMLRRIGPPKTEADVKLCLRAFNLAVDWTEDLPIENYEQIRERAHWYIPMAGTQPGYPEWQEGLGKLQQRYLSNWQECHTWLLNNLRNSEGRSEEVNKKAYENYLWYVTISDSLGDTLPIELAAPAYENAVAGILEVFEGIVGPDQNVPPLHALDRNARESFDQRFLEGMLIHYSSFAERHGNSPHSEATRVSLRATAEKLTSSKLVFFSVYGRLLEHLMESPDVEMTQHDYRIRDGAFRDEKRQKEITFLEEMIASLPPETRREDAAVLFQIGRKFGIGASARNRLIPPDGEAASELRESMPHSVLYPETEAGALRSLELIGQTEAQLRDDLESGRRDKDEVESTLHGIRQTRDWLQRKAGMVKYAAPWKEKVDLLPPGRTYVEPTIRNDRLHVFEIDTKDKRVRHLTVNLEDRAETEGIWIRLALDGMKDNPDSSWEHSSRHRRFYSAFVDENNAYLGTAGFGILVFPLDQSKPWRITTEQGLPSDIVQGVGVLNGVLYAGVGEKKGASYFVRAEIGRGVSECRAEILSATIDEIGKAPFANQPASTHFHLFVPDEKRHRLLFTVRMDGYPTPRTAGVWSVDVSGRFAQIPDVFDKAEKMELLPDGETLLMGDHWGGGTLDLRSNEYTLVAASLYRGETDTFAVWNKRMKPALGPGHRFDVMTIADGWVWGMRRESGVQCFWARVKLDDPNQWSLLELPEGMNPENDGWFPDENILAHPNGKAVIACTLHRIVLFQW